MDYPKFDVALTEKLPLEKEFISKVLEKYLIEAKNPVEIEKEYYSKYYSTGALAVKVLNNFGLISSKKEFDNKGLYFGEIKDNVIAFLNNGDERCKLIAKVMSEEELDLEIISEAQEELIEYTEEDFKKDVFIDNTKYKDIVELLNRKKNIILTGAPGVGKTFMAKRLVYSLMRVKDDSRVSFIQFHQSYSYEEFVEGFRPSETDGFYLEKGIFFDFCKRALKDSRPHYLIIDEINRGNLSKIFGELLMLIESDKRGKKLTLAYSKEEFFVPNNLYIIGLMNTADRSLAMIDYALRRRFSFIHIEPAYKSDKFKNIFFNTFEENCYDVLELIKDLNEDIKTDSALGEGFMVGHSYFCVNFAGRKANKEDVNRILQYEIEPLIEEYWYDDKPMLEKWKTRIEEFIKR